MYQQNDDFQVGTRSYQYWTSIEQAIFLEILYGMIPVNCNQSIAVLLCGLRNTDMANYYASEKHLPGRIPLLERFLAELFATETLLLLPWTHRKLCGCYVAETHWACYVSMLSCLNVSLCAIAQCTKLATTCVTCIRNTVHCN